MINKFFRVLVLVAIAFIVGCQPSSNIEGRYCYKIETLTPNPKVYYSSTQPWKTSNNGIWFRTLDGELVEIMNCSVSVTMIAASEVGKER